MITTEKLFKQNNFISIASEVIAQERRDGYVLVFKVNRGPFRLQTAITIASAREPYTERIFKSLDSLASTAKRLGAKKSNSPITRLVYILM